MAWAYKDVPRMTLTMDQQNDRACRGETPTINLFVRIVMKRKNTRHTAFQVIVVRHGDAPPAPEAKSNPRIVGTRASAIQDGLAG